MLLLFSEFFFHYLNCHFWLKIVIFDFQIQYWLEWNVKISVKFNYFLFTVEMYRKSDYLQGITAEYLSVETEIFRSFLKGNTNRFTVRAALIHR